MTSSKQMWKYRPLSDRRRDDRADKPTRAAGSADPGATRSSVTPSKIQRSASLIYQPDVLTSQIKDFLQRTDRSSRERWRSKSRSVDVGVRDSDKVSSRSTALSPNSCCSDRSISSRENSIWEEVGEVSEGGTEDDAVSSICSEKSGPATSHRVYLGSISEKYSTLSQTGGKIERINEKVLLHESINGTDNLESDSISKRRYESLKKQFHIAKVKLNQEHDAEMDKILSLKKQLEKRLYDAYESLDEQKQLVCQWKKKFGKLSADLSETRLQLDDQLSQKTLMDKKRRKEDSDFQYLIDELNQEQKRSDKLFKEKEHIIQENGKLEQSVTDLRIEIQTKTIQIKSLSEELNSCKNSISDLEIENIKKNNNKLKQKCLGLEEELEKSLRQIDMMEEAKHKMEQNIDRLKKEQKKEISQREDEIEEVKYNFEKKFKSLHCQIEQEIHEKSLLMKDKYKLERQIDDLQECVSQSQSSATSLLDKMKNKLIKTKALLKDERFKDQGVTKENNKVLLRKLKNQLDGVELEKLTAIKSKHKYEMEYSDLASNMAEIEKAKSEAERKLEDALKEIKIQQKLVDDKDEEMTEIMTRFSSTTQQLAQNQILIQDMTDKITNVQSENSSLLVQIASLQVKLESQESLATSSSKLQAENYKAKIKELESKNELDKAMISRREQQLSQISMQLEKALFENDRAQNMLIETAREIKTYTRQVRDLQEESKKLSQRETDLLMRNKDLAMKVEAGETEKNMLTVELKLANERIAKLKEAMDDSASYYSDSSTESVEDTVSIVTIDDFKFRSETPDSIMSGLSEYDIRKEKY